jgi:hypothetical protein
VGAKIGDDVCCGLVAAHDGFDVQDLTCVAAVAVIQILDRAERAVRDIDRVRLLVSPEQVGILEGDSYSKIDPDLPYSIPPDPQTRGQDRHRRR